MAENKEQQELVEIGEKLVKLLDGLLSVGDWQSSSFLRLSLAKIESLRDKAEKICGRGGEAQDVVSEAVVEGKKEVPEGYRRVFVLLYQVEGGSLLNWFSVIKSLTEYSINRPVYEDENHLQEVIRSKVSGSESNGYVIVDVKEGDLFRNPEQLDTFGHQLSTLKEKAVDMEHIVEFIHANRKRYVVREKGLEFLGEISRKL